MKTLQRLGKSLMLPVAWIRGEKFGWAGALGALIAVAGVAVLFTV